MKLAFQAREQMMGVLVFICAISVAALLTSSHAGSWNDGSRLATVESLVDRGTWVIDDSIFVRVPPMVPGKQSPYRAEDELLVVKGTADKLWIDGHFYSDKSPVPALVMAVEYALLKTWTGLEASEQPERFCWIMSFSTSGLAYALAVWCFFLLGKPLGLSPRLRLGLTASFALSTIALPYAGYVNNHILLLAVSVRLLTDAAWLGQASVFQSWRRLFTLGTLAGLGYGIDLGAGPVFFFGTMLLVAWHCRSYPKSIFCLAAAFPWLALHHAINYAIGGAWKPANAVLAYFDWPGCPFNATNMTGIWHHEGPIAFLLYAFDLLVGKKGFLFHDLPLLVAVPGTWLLLSRPRPERPEILLCVFWFLGIWLAYGATSNNAAGVCCSIRWFVPLLGPGYYLLALVAANIRSTRPTSYY